MFDDMTTSHKKAMRQLGYSRRTLLETAQNVKFLAYITNVRTTLKYTTAV